MKILTGKVIGVKSGNTATVAVERVIVHPLYKKRFRREKKYLVHDETGVKTGDVVKFAAGRPVSKLKKWRIIK